MPVKRRSARPPATATPHRRGGTSLENLVRRGPSRPVLPTILIVCDGQNTEPSYFKQFRLASARIVAIGSGNNTTSTVQQAISLSKQAEYDQVWCVFDRDSFPANNFNSAIARALANGLHVAYSNQAFEYWLLLHFENHDGSPMHRTDYATRLNTHLAPFGLHYDGTGSKIISPELFALLQAADPSSGRTRRKIAIGRARRIDQSWVKQGTPPAQQESTTLVYKLVQVIQRHMEYPR
ncbi:RloB family protein [Hymenobacter gummosus]|nr:RloB family protein [Hymenobacter gummosus]